MAQRSQPRFFTGLVVTIIFFLVLIYFVAMQSRNYYRAISYVALGDSYTFSEGASLKEAWPLVLTKHLQQNGVNVELMGNLGVSGWTSQQLIDKQLPLFDRLDPEFATVLIGANDVVHGVNDEQFHQNLNVILDHVQAKLPNKQQVILITIPDFTVTPRGSLYGNGKPEQLSQTIQRFNDIIIEEGRERNLPVVDIFPVSQEMKHRPELVSPDGLHPTGLEYVLWEKMIYPIAYSTLHHD